MWNEYVKMIVTQKALKDVDSLNLYSTQRRLATSWSHRMLACYREGVLASCLKLEFSPASDDVFGFSSATFSSVKAD